jgi:predicted amidophosphoribosyltransferase
MANFQPRRIIGKWSQGYALDYHSVSSVFLGHNQFGHPEYDTKRSEVGELLDGLHEVDTPATQDKKILLFDDLYRSGATMNAITAALYEQGKAAEVFALTITRTRSNQ